ncbi:MAG: hypothetical protein VW644_00790 [Alphaproteobacteria bacterium]|jgi:hypothetical protein
MPGSGGGKTGVLQQILVAVAIAVLAGGTSPWWWNELKPLIAGAANDQAGAPTTPGQPATQPDRGANAPGGSGSTGSTIATPNYIALADAAADAERIQAWYLRGRNDGLECGVYRDIVMEIRKFAGNPRPLPAQYADTLRYAGTNPAQTISSLAIDRSRRIVSARTACF